MNLFIDYLFCLCYRQSLRLTHGARKAFVLAFSRDLGTVRLVNVEWTYDHEIDLLDPLKVCVLLLCSGMNWIYVSIILIYKRLMQKNLSGDNFLQIFASNQILWIYFLIKMDFIWVKNIFLELLFFDRRHPRPLFRS